MARQGELRLQQLGAAVDVFGSRERAFLQADARRALDLLEVDRYGLDEIDQKIMITILDKYRGGPVGVNTIAASISEESDTIEEVYEP